MAFGVENTGLNSVKEAEQNLVPEAEKSAEQLVDHLVAKLDELLTKHEAKLQNAVQKYAKLLSGESQASGTPTKGE